MVIVIFLWAVMLSVTLTTAILMPAATGVILGLGLGTVSLSILLGARMISDEIEKLKK